jgi:thiamine-monophosphate kinase
VGTGEFEVVAWLRSRFPLVGDDAAVVGDGLLLAADAIVQGVDFSARSDLALVGWRAVWVNCSDIAAMGGRPEHLLVSVIAPPGVEVQAVMEGVGAAASAHGCEVAGGDLSSTSGPLVVSVAVTGSCDGQPVLRSGARPGDGVFVTGPLGGAAASGYALSRGLARLAEGGAARLAGATAMIDISDGLAADLGHVLDASGVGVILDDVPVADGATLEDALGGGDDYELLFTLPSGVDAPADSIRVGTISDDVSRRPPAVAGWQHRFT